jgi:hypothetical protein
MKIYLAGTHGDREGLLNNYKNLNLLESFYYLKDTHMSLYKKHNFLLDSGAFTFMNNTKSSINWDSYIEKYGAFINKWDIDYFFELDIDSIVGTKEVDRLRSKLETITNKKSIPVWHKSRGLEYWKQMCKDYDYVSIGGIVTKEIKSSEYKIFNPLLKIAKDNNCKVHGLGFTRTRDLHKYKFYSVDSTNWITGRFNMYYLFNQTKGIMQSQPKNNLRVKKEEATRYNQMQIDEWVKFSNYADVNL